MGVSPQGPNELSKNLPYRVPDPILFFNAVVI